MALRAALLWLALAAAPAAAATSVRPGQQALIDGYSSSSSAWLSAPGDLDLAPLAALYRVDAVPDSTRAPSSTFPCFTRSTLSAVPEAAQCRAFAAAHSLSPLPASPQLLKRRFSAQPRC
jgi:hypothetical protein